MRSDLVCLLLLSGSAAASQVWAQAVPDAGALRQQFDNELKPALPPRAPPLPGEAAAPLKLPQGTTLTVKAFRFEGNALLDAARLHAAVRGWEGHPIGFADLERAAQAVAAAYREAGWIVQTWLPKQDVTEGFVTIRVVEARFAGVRVEGGPALRLSPELVVDEIQSRQAVGAPLNADALDRGLLLANDLPGVAVSGALEPGAKDGETALVLRMSDEPFVAANVGLDNGGSRSTGSGRATATVYVNSPLHAGDQVRIDLADSRGSHYGRAAWTVPLGADGLRAGVNASHLDYRLVGNDFAALHGSGSSGAWGVDFSYPFIRSRQRNLYGSFNVERTAFLNRANGVRQSDYAIDAVTLGLNGNVFDDLGGGGASSASLSWEVGDLRQGQLDPGENAALAGGYDKLHYGAARQQVLTETLSLSGTLAGQYAHKALDSSGRFYLGGPSGVRAYPVNEGSGDRGQLASLELHWRAQDAFTLVGFEDWGHVSDSHGDNTLKGAGVSLVWSGPWNLDAQATLARRIGSNGQPGAHGRDQDGTLDRNRFWLQARLPL